jgi:uncharacterized membrane protein
MNKVSNKYKNMHKFKRLIISGGLAVFCFSSCTHKSDLTNVRTVSFKSDVLPVFQTNCAMCHGNSSGGDGGDKNYTSYDGVMKDITAGNANKSKIYSVITSTISRMPPTSHNALNQDQRSLIYVWIEQGAQNN